MIEETWKLFSETGNIEAYLLFKELEKEQMEKNEEYDMSDEEQMDFNGPL